MTHAKFYFFLKSYDNVCSRLGRLYKTANKIYLLEINLQHFIDAMHSRNGKKKSNSTGKRRVTA